ncbi:MAG: ImmA/IrrE family metallo-endopeptidase [Phycisphaera sp.]|nr:ImmA/IrrE family metallo-endopeptidase [Phycisphaera sp.]
MAKVKYLTQSAIERAALCLLAEYGDKYGEVVDPPVPVEAIVEGHLRLGFDFDDLPTMLGIDGVLGAISFPQRHVFVDQSLDPETFPHKEGRCRFTIAHEVGHWELHRHQFTADTNQSALFGDDSKPSIVCRARSRKEPAEWQADMFSGYLLMPKEMVLRAWRSRFGELDPYVARDEIADLSARWGLGEDEQPTVEVAKDMARDFKVSGQAMQIRLIGLGLIRTEVPEPDLFTQ